MYLIEKPLKFLTNKKIEFKDIVAFKRLFIVLH